MNNSDSFDRKSFRKAKFESKKKNRKDFLPQGNEDYRFSKISKQNIKKKKHSLGNKHKMKLKKY